MKLDKFEMYNVIAWASLGTALWVCGVIQVVAAGQYVGVGYFICGVFLVALQFIKVARQPKRFLDDDNIDDEP